jgi:hypothetical protein
LVSGAGEGADVADTDNLKTAYEQLCTSYRAIDDFRAKLLGFLPLVTGGGLILLAGQATGGTKEFEKFFGPAGLFGIAVTAGLLAYELFGIKKCHALLNAGEDLERKMDLPVGDVNEPAGQFVRRPKHLLGVVNEPFAAAAIYPAVLAAWTYLALFFDHRGWARNASLTVFAVGFMGILLYDQSLKPDSRVRKLGIRLTSFVRRLRRRAQSAQSPPEADDSTGGIVKSCGSAVLHDHAAAS